jgi:GNAT superfamily N-acetyltransferase
MGEVTDIATALGGQITSPSPLADFHDLSVFRSGNEPLDDWLRVRARKSEGNFGRTYVVCSGHKVIAYYTLSTGGEKREQTPSKIRRNSPDQIPLVLLARLAVDSRFKGKGIGKGLLKDAFSRIIQLAEIVGFRAVVVHAVDDNAKKFYEKFGFLVFPNGSQTLYLPIDTLRRAL